MKCFNCKWPQLKDLKAPKNVMAKTCVNCGKVQAPRQSQRSKNPVRK